MKKYLLKHLKDLMVTMNFRMVGNITKKIVQNFLRTIEETEKNGMLVAQRLKWVKKLDTNLYELRSKVGSNIQRAIYFHVVNGRYVITHGFTKNGENTNK